MPKKRGQAAKAGKNPPHDHPLYGKVFIRGELEVLTGLHIGGPQGPLEIGGIDMPVIKDPMNNEPYISGSSLKGKLRSLFERRINRDRPGGFFKMVAGTRDKPIRIHVCSDGGCVICRLFGSSPPAEAPEGQNIPSPLLVRDLHLKNADALKALSSPLPYTEWKSENVLDRISAHATPRDIERVPKEAKFELELVYSVANPDNIVEDLSNLVCALGLLEDDALGGQSSRGYGKVRFFIESIAARRVEYYDALAAKGDFSKYEKANYLTEGRHTIAKLKENIVKIANEIKSFMNQPGGERPSEH